MDVSECEYRNCNSYQVGVVGTRRLSNARNWLYVCVQLGLPMTEQRRLTDAVLRRFFCYILIADFLCLCRRGCPVCSIEFVYHSSRVRDGTRRSRGRMPSLSPTAIIDFSRVSSPAIRLQVDYQLLVDEQYRESTEGFPLSSRRRARST